MLEFISSSTYTSGREFSQKLIISQSFPIAFRRDLLTSPIKRSLNPPIHGASSTINFHLILSFAAQESTSFSDRICLHTFSIISEASLNCYALSELISFGLPYRDKKLLNPSRNCSIDISENNPR